MFELKIINTQPLTMALYYKMALAALFHFLENRQFSGIIQRLGVMGTKEKHLL
jgi:hypothetical protein